VADETSNPDNLAGTWVEQRLIARERVMQAMLDSTRAGTKHPTTIGDSAEKAVRDVLRAHLPVGLGVGHGHVHDSFGNVSKQTDVVITNSEHPFTSPEPEDADEFFLEGVSAVGEVKASFGTKEFDSCVVAGTRFKQLCPMFDPEDRVLHRNLYTMDTNGMPPYVIFAFDSSYTMETLRQKLTDVPPAQPHEAYASNGVQPQPPIDAVCVLGKYVLWNLRHVDGPIMLKDGAGERARGWVGITTTAPLSWTLSWLQVTMPRIVRNKPVFAYYIGQKTLVGAEKLDEATENNGAASLSGDTPNDGTLGGPAASASRFNRS
jgi:hypothetical protein